MKIAIPLTGGCLSDHFGHCERFALIEADLVSRQILTQTMVVPPPHEPGALPRWRQQQGVQIITAGGMGRGCGRGARGAQLQGPPEACVPDDPGKNKPG